jgi:hypothetical protein
MLREDGRQALRERYAGVKQARGTGSEHLPLVDALWCWVTQLRASSIHWPSDAAWVGLWWSSATSFEHSAAVRLRAAEGGRQGMRKVGDRIRENQRGHTIPFDGGADGTPA